MTLATTLQSLSQKLSRRFIASIHDANPLITKVMRDLQSYVLLCGSYFNAVSRNPSDTRKHAFIVDNVKKRHDEFVQSATALQREIMSTHNREAESSMERLEQNFTIESIPLKSHQDFLTTPGMNEAIQRSFTHAKEALVDLQLALIPAA